MIYLNTQEALGGNADLLGEVLKEKSDPAPLTSTRLALGTNVQCPVSGGFYRDQYSFRPTALTYSSAHLFPMKKG